jgi:glycosyltransferase involved in cell wall biosynthesis
VPSVLIVPRGRPFRPYELRPWLELPDRYQVSYMLTGPDRFPSLDGLRVVPARTLRELLPNGPIGELAAIALGDRYISAKDAFARADIVHAGELSFWGGAEAARRRRRYGFRLVQTVGETLPLLAAYRNRHARRFREQVLAETDLYLTSTERAALALEIEGIPPERIAVCPPGIDATRFSTPPSTQRPAVHTIISPGRLVWEKGHHDILRALALLHRGMIRTPAGETVRPRLRIIGSGHEESRLRAHAAELGLSDAVEILSVAHEEMPAVYAEASAMVLASQSSATAQLNPYGIPHAFWEEQFGWVLAEAMATSLAIIATTSGAIPEVVRGTPVELVAAGDWPAIARALAAGPLARPPGARVSYPEAILRRYSSSAAAERLTAAYDRLLAA